VYQDSTSYRRWKYCQVSSASPTSFDHSSPYSIQMAQHKAQLDRALLWVSVKLHKLVVVLQDFSTAMQIGSSKSCTLFPHSQKGPPSSLNNLPLENRREIVVQIIEEARAASVEKVVTNARSVWH